MYHPRHYQVDITCPSQSEKPGITQVGHITIVATTTQVARIHNLTVVLGHPLTLLHPNLLLALGVIIQPTDGLKQRGVGQ